MAKRIPRKLTAYNINGHTSAGTSDEDVLDYSSFFETLYGAEMVDLRVVMGPDLVAVSSRSKRGEAVAFQFVSGSGDDQTLIFNMHTGEAAESDPGQGNLYVNGAWVIVYPERRRVVVENRRPGVPIARIEKFLSQFGRNVIGLRGLTVSLTPVPSESFAEEVARFDRIREASVVVVRPNQSWTTDARGLLGRIAAESDAAKTEVSVTAERGESLSKQSGLVPEIVGTSQGEHSSIEAARIRGSVRGFDGERSISLESYTVRGSTRIDPAATSFEQLESMLPIAEQLSLGNMGELEDEVEDEDAKLLETERGESGSE